MDGNFESDFEALLDRYAANEDWREGGRAEVVDILRLKLEALEIEEFNDNGDGEDVAEDG